MIDKQTANLPVKRIWILGDMHLGVRSNSMEWLEIQKDFYVDLDINGYKKKKIDYLKEMAKNAADEVSLMKQEKILPPMPAYERRIVHLELAERKDITTESIGREPERKIIIRSYP